MHITVSGDSRPDDHSGQPQRPHRPQLVPAIPRQGWRPESRPGAQSWWTGPSAPPDVIEHGRPRRWPGRSRAVVGLALVAAAIAIVATDQASRSKAPVEPVADRPGVAYRTGAIIDESLRATALAALRVVPGTRSREAVALRSGAGAASVSLGLAAGDYVAELICVGGGAALLSVTVDGAPTRTVPLGCVQSPLATSMGISTDGGQVTLVANPGPETTAALAWRIRRA